MVYSIREAIKFKVDVINLSVDFIGKMPLLEEACQEAVDAGIALIIAAGNASTKEISTPYSIIPKIIDKELHRFENSTVGVIEKLKGLKFDLSIFREDKWQGRPVYVVGAKQGDLHSQQFWIDQKNMCFVRMLRPGGKDGAQTQETQFSKYVKLGGGWMSPEVIFMVDGKVVTTEEYSDLRANVSLDSKLFDPQYFATVHWKE